MSSNSNNIIPGRDAQEWASFNSEYRYLLSPVITSLCFLIVWLGSIHGLKEWLQTDSAEVSFLLAAGVAFLIQQLNSVCVHYSTRMIAAFFVYKATKRNKNQHFGGTGITIGIVCLLLTSGICYFDYNTNKEGNEAIVNSMLTAPSEVSVDANPHKEVISLAKNALDAELAAQKTEETAFYRSIDSDINRKKRNLEARRKQISGKTWAVPELKQISGKLNNLEIERKDRKADFIPKQTDVMGKKKAYADVAGTQSSLLSMKQAEVDTFNSKGKKEYEGKKSARRGSMMTIYWVAMLLWHICHCFLHFRAFKFDEIHIQDNNPVLAILTVIWEMLKNWAWIAHANINKWRPEDAIHGITNTELIEKMQSQVCADTFGLILQNPGIKEMLIYMSLKNHSLDSVRHSLRLLKTGKMIFENSGTWRADQNQTVFFEKAGFFFEKIAVKKTENPASNTTKSTNFELEISYRISMLIDLMSITPSPEIEYRIEMLQNILSI